MDLSFSRPIPADEAALPAADMALLAALLAARPGGSATALVQAALDRPVVDEPLLAPATGAFSAAMAARLSAWSHE